MGVPTRVYPLEEDLMINIPRVVLPPKKRQRVEERVVTPGYPAQTKSWYYVIVRPYTDRTSLLLTSDLSMSEIEAMSRLGLDPNKPIYVHFPDTPRDSWVKAHIYHGYYGRVNVPASIERKFKISEYQVYPVLISGITLPKIEIIPVYRYVRSVEINHMGKIYPAENVGPNRWRWRIPKTIESYPVLMKAISLNVYPEAQCHPSDNYIDVDFIFSSAAGMIVSENIGYAFRNMAVRNYTATVEVDYPFLCEIRATYISCTPKMFYQPSLEHHILLEKALEITVYNILQHFFQKAKPDYPYSTMSYADHIDAIDYTTNQIKLSQSYPDINRAVQRIDDPYEKKTKQTYLQHIAPGKSEQYETRDMEKKLYYCIKYVRILNESSYKQGDLDRWVYLNNEIEAMIREKQHERVMVGMEQDVDIDSNGFIWEI